MLTKKMTSTGTYSLTIKHRLLTIYKLTLPSNVFIAVYANGWFCLFSAKIAEFVEI